MVVKPHRPARSSAFMMADVLVALALITGTIAVAVLFFRTQVREARQIHERFAARLIAESEIERLHARAYETIPVDAKQALKLTLPSADQLKGAQAALHAREIEPGLKQVRIVVRWRSRRGRPRQVGLTGEFSREGLRRD